MRSFPIVSATLRTEPITQGEHAAWWMYNEGACLMLRCYVLCVRSSP